MLWFCKVLSLFTRSTSEVIGQYDIPRRGHRWWDPERSLLGRVPENLESTSLICASQGLYCDFQASLENYAVYRGVHYIVVIALTLGLLNVLVYSSYLLCSARLSAVLSGAKQISIVIVIITIVLLNSCAVSELNTRLLHISHKMLQ